MLRIIKFSLLFCSALMGVTLFAADDSVHVGVFTCGSSTCHAADKPWQHSSILQNEFITWSQYDRHSKSYQTLLNEKSRLIAQRLGIGKAHESNTCLNCHADNVSMERRGKRFKIEDGVQCEACHGGARKWLGPHSTGVNTREENIRAGLYPTENSAARAKLCLSCHLGTDSKQVNHELYMAGHPRLRFELDTYTLGQPAHFKVDEDYLSRKRNAGSVNVWALGQAYTAKGFTQNFLHSLNQHKSNSLTPELSFFDCQACHHQVGTLNWKPQRNANLPPGSPRLADASLTMVKIILSSTDSDLENQLSDAIRNLHQATIKGYDETINAAQKVSSTMDRVIDHLGSTEFNRKQSNSILSKLLEYGKDYYFFDYIDAEQATMALAMLVDTLNSSEIKESDLDTLYQNLDDELNYQPQKFKQDMERISTLLN